MPTNQDSICVLASLGRHYTVAAMTLQYVDLETARGARGTRIVTSGLVPSPWSEATKGLFELAKLPALVVSRPRTAPEMTAWTQVDNVPVVLHDDEPNRTNWAAIVGLVARLAPGVVVAVDPRERAEQLGILEMIAGEEGLGWNARLSMIHASFESDGARGFPPPIAAYLAKRYGHTRATSTTALRDRVGVQLGILRDRLRGDYFGGATPNALDVYSATFLTPLQPIDDTVCPQMTPGLRATFGTAHETFRDLLPAELIAHRTRMFDRHLSWPIRL